LGTLESAHLGPLIMRIKNWVWIATCWMLALTSPVTLAQNRYWYDGSVLHSLWLDSAWVADFSKLPADPSGVLRLSGASGIDTRIQSPVFRDSAQGEGQLRALPGGVLLRFRAHQGPADRQALAAKHGLMMAREIGGSGRVWLVATPAGLASLDLANRLHESGDFESASPNWWQFRARK
jgi:hypothetical protein